MTNTQLLKLRSSVVSSNSITPRQVIEAPNGGWGWIVCFGVFGINFIINGMMMSFGILLVSLLNFFEDTRAKTAWIGSVGDGMLLIAGPVVSLLLRYLSHREIIIGGTFIGVIGYIISIWMPNVEALIVTYGLLAGAGYGMAFIAANVIIGLYFTSKRALAVGIAMSGSGVGVLAYSYFAENMLNYYGWRSTVLLLAGIALHCVIFGSLSRPLKWKLKSQTKSLSNSNSNSNSSQETEELNDDKSITTIATTDSIYTDLMNTLQVPNHIKSAGNLSPARYHKTINNATSKVVWGHTVDFESNTALTLSFNTLAQKNTKHKTLSKPLLSHNLKKHKNNHSLLHIFNESRSNIRCISMETIGGLYNSYSLTVNFGGSEGSENSDDVSIFSDVVMVLLLIAMTLCSAQGAVLAHLPSYALSVGISSENTAFILSLVGIMTTVGQLLIGFLIDILHVTSIYAYTCALLGATIMTCIIPWLDSVILLAVCSAAFGLCMGWTISLRTILLADLVGVENLTRVFGVVALFQGTGLVATPPLAGLLYDFTESYLALFLMCTASYGVAAICALLLCYFYRTQDTCSETLSYSDPES